MKLKSLKIFSIENIEYDLIFLRFFHFNILSNESLAITGKNFNILHILLNVKKTDNLK